jgi:glycosyltransferase involved in cell wall biosynthesis
MIFHVVANALLPTKKEYCTDYFTQMCIKFCDMMYSRGHTIYFYGIEQKYTDVMATCYITVLPLKNYDELNKLTDNYTTPYLLCYNYDLELDLYKKNFIKHFTSNLELKLHENYKTGDIVVHTLRDYFPLYDDTMLNVTLSHGGGYVCGDNIVFMTDAWKNIVLDPTYTLKSCEIKTHCVIYPWYSKEEVDFLPEKKRLDNTFLYLARCQIVKGFAKFLEYSEKFPNYKFIIAGGCKLYDKTLNILNTGEKDGIFNLNNYKNVTYLGKIGIAEKKNLLQTVTALIQPTLYVEPGGSNVMEASLCGTPVIAPNCGGFTNTVINGKTGILYNDDTDKDYIISSVKNIKNVDCYQYATSFLNEKIAYCRYIEYFNFLLQ